MALRVYANREGPELARSAEAAKGSLPFALNCFNSMETTWGG